MVAKSTHPIPRKILNCEDAATYCCISRTTLWDLLKTSDFPEPIMLTTRVRAWRIADLDDWIESRARRRAA